MTDSRTIELQCSHCGLRVIVYTEDWLRDKDALDCPILDCNGVLNAPTAEVSHD